MNIKLFVTQVYKVEGDKKPIVNTIKKLQLTILSLSAITKGSEPGYVIIPIPLHKGQNEINILKYTKNRLFNTCGALFAKNKSKNDWDYLINEAKMELPHTSSFKTKILVNFRELAKMANVIKIPKETLRIIKNYYSEKFAFILCTIEESANYTPLAYVHELPRAAKKLFLPLRILNTHQEHINMHEHLCIYEEDEYVRHAQARLRPTDDKPHNIDKNMNIFVFKEIPDKKIARTGIYTEKLAQDSIQKYIKRKLLPRGVTYTVLSDLYKLTVGNNYKLNADLYV